MKYKMSAKEWNCTFNPITYKVYSIMELMAVSKTSWLPFSLLRVPALQKCHSAAQRCGRSSLAQPERRRSRRPPGLSLRRDGGGAALAQRCLLPQQPQPARPGSCPPLCWQARHCDTECWLSCFADGSGCAGRRQRGRARAGTGWAARPARPHPAPRSALHPALPCAETGDQTSATPPFL